MPNFQIRSSLQSHNLGELSLPYYLRAEQIIEESALEEYSSVNLSAVKSIQKPDFHNTDGRTTNFYEEVIKSYSSHPFLDSISEEIKMQEDYSMASIDNHYNPKLTDTIPQIRDHMLLLHTAVNSNRPSMRGDSSS